MGCDFARGTRIVARPQVAHQRKLTSLQVLLLQSLWAPIESPNIHNSQMPWPSRCQSIKRLCGQHASLQLPSKAIAPLLQSLQQRAGIDPNKAELDVNEILASHSDPRYYQWQRTIMDHTAWQLNPTDTGYLDVQCTGLGGGELDTDWDVLVACKKEAHVYGPSLSKQDDWATKTGTVAGTAHTQEYLLLHIAMLPIGLHAWGHVLGATCASSASANHQQSSKDITLLPDHTCS